GTILTCCGLAGDRNAGDLAGLELVELHASDRCLAGFTALMCTDLLLWFISNARRRSLA
uniref:Uncharacterized protein n=1 Tax=Aegilops tauschii subsp. strangulata TaxID=200361 RepID=A0A453RZ47_AEGTS